MCDVSVSVYLYWSITFYIKIVQYMCSRVYLAMEMFILFQTNLFRIINNCMQNVFFCTWCPDIAERLWAFCKQSSHISDNIYFCGFKVYSIHSWILCVDMPCINIIDLLYSKVEVFQSLPWIVAKFSWHSKWRHTKKIKS